MALGWAHWPCDKQMGAFLRNNNNWLVIVHMHGTESSAQIGAFSL